jgi:DNA polymerase-3 subunit delta
LDLNELKKAIKKGVASSYLLLGSDLLGRDEAFEIIKNNALPREQQEYALSIFDKDTAGIEEIIVQAETYPIFSDKRLIYLKGYEALTKSDQEAVIELIEKRIPTTVLVLSARDLDLRQTLVKKLLEITVVVHTQPPVDKNLVGWLMQKGRELGLNLDPTVAAYIMERVGYEPIRLNSELEKLAVYRGTNQQKITKTDVDEVIIQGVVEPEKNAIFHFCDAVATGKPGIALNLLDELLAVGTNHILINHMLARHFRQLLAVKASGGQSAEDIKARIKLGLADFAINRLINQARARKLADLENALVILLDSDLKLKRGADPRSILESTILKISS